MKAEDRAGCEIGDERLFIRLVLASGFLVTGTIVALLLLNKPSSTYACGIRTAFVVFSFTSSLTSYVGAGRQLLSESNS
jgi:hypothetical protein